MNLSVNAADAMPEGGQLTIETGLTDLDEAYAAMHPEVTPGRYVMLSVSDTGLGMDDETKGLIFDPFFSTKGKRGTGLGLATVHGIVKQHGSHIWVYSEKGMGTTFKIYFPVVEESIEKKQFVEKQPVHHRQGNETILLVEDNSQVRHLSRTILERQGYEVLEADTGKSALEAITSHKVPVDLLLTDVVIPGMNGREVYQKAAEHYPGLKVLFMSGYPDEVIAQKGVLEKGIQFIQKPFSVEGLSAKVRDVLDSPVNKLLL